MVSAPRLVLASNNPGKLREFRRLLEPLGITVIPQSELGIPEADEPYPTFVENALAKARHASALAQLPALADDSGICVDALRGAPGVLSARYAGEPKSDARNNAQLIADLAGVGNRAAHYACVLVLVRHAVDPEPMIAHSGRPVRLASLEGKWSPGDVVSDVATHPLAVMMGASATAAVRKPANGGASMPPSTAKRRVATKCQTESWSTYSNYFDKDLAKKAQKLKAGY